MPALRKKPGTAPPPLLPIALLSLAPLLWAGNFVLARAMHAAIPPISLAFWRWVLALALILPFGLPHLRRQWPEVRRGWKMLVLLGVVGVGSFNTLVYLGLQTTTATNGLVLNSVIPVLILALSRIFLGQRLRPAQTLGVGLSLAGVWMLIFRADPALMLQLRFNSGDLWILAAALCWAIYTVLLRQTRAGYHPLTFLTTSIGVGVLAIFPLYLWELARGAHFALNGPNLGTLLYVGLCASIIAYLCWNHGVAEVGASRAGLFLHLMPVFGTLLSVVFLGESLHLFHGGSVLLIFSGIYLTQKG